MHTRQKLTNPIRMFKRMKPMAKSGLILGVLSMFITTLLIFSYHPKVSAQIFITTGSSWSVPSDWSSSSNTIEVIGGSGGGGGGFQQTNGNGGLAGGGGGGGGYSKAVNVTLAPGSAVTVAIGGAGTGGANSTNGTAGGDTYLCNSTVNCTNIGDTSVVAGAKGGDLGSAGTSVVAGAGGAGGAAASGVGSLKYNGGAGGTGGSPVASTGGGGAGGGGAAGPNATGNAGATPVNDTHGNGGQGDGSSGGAAGTTSGANGGDGTEFDATHGSGGGAAGGDGSKNGVGAVGGIGGTYGAGGGGGGGNGRSSSPGGAGGNGNQGLIRIIYNYTIQADYRWRSDDGNETTGTSLAAQNTAATITYGTNVRLRFNILNRSSDTSYTYQLEYAPYGLQCGSWTTVPNSATTEHFNMFNTSNYADQAASTNVSSGPGVITNPTGYTFTAGKLVKTPSNSAAIALTSLQYTEIEYSLTANSNATGISYCFRLTNAGTALEEYDNYPILNINYPPTTPIIYSVLDSATNASRLPFFQLKSTDNNKDYLKYVVEVCAANSWPCSSGARTYDQTSSQTCWNGQNSQTATAYESSEILASSTMAYCQMPTTDILLPSTTYYMRAKAKDPGGSNTFTAYSSVATFTTGSLDISILGNTSITGNTIIGN